MKPFAIISDLHFHNWSAFSTVDVQGENSRLRILLNEVRRAVQELKDAGGDTLYIAGDVFHVRGEVAPSVFNPVLAVFADIIDMRGSTVRGINVNVLAGNHDLETDSASWAGSAVTLLGDVGAISANDGPTTVGQVAMFPWQENIEELKRQLVKGQTNKRIAIIHAPINDTIQGLPNTGLDPAWLNSLDYQAIFAGHYHHHKQHGEKVWSIGAIAHHTWNDVGSKAGFLIVHPKENGVPEVVWRASRAPSFVELDASMSIEDMQLAADGNYVKARLNTADAKTLESIRQTLIAAGAKGVILQPDVTKVTTAREDTSIKKGMTLAQSLNSYIDGSGYARKAELKHLCGDILTAATGLEA